MDENVFRGVLRFDELHNLHGVATCLQKEGADGVGQKRGKPFGDNAVFHKGEQEMIFLPERRFPVFQLTVQLMLAAGHCKDNRYLPPDSLCKRQIGCCIAGMEAHHHAGTVVQRMIGDIAFRKA